MEAELKRIIDGARAITGRLESLIPIDRQRFLTAQIRGLASEIQSAYTEQVTWGRNYRLSKGDVGALNRRAAWAEHELALAEWRQNEDNDRMEQLHNLDPNDERAVAAVKTRPKHPPWPEPGLPAGCPEISEENPLAWDRAVWEFLRARR